MELTALTYDLVKALDDFTYTLSASDRVWNILFPGEANRWHHLHVKKYRDTFYITHINGDGGSLEVEPEKGVRAFSIAGVTSSSVQSGSQSVAVWGLLIRSAYSWLKVVRKDWIKANKRVRGEYPLRYRYGVAPHAIIRASLPNVYRVDSELGMPETLGFVRLVEDGFFLKAENIEASTMTASDYFNYCRIAYIAGKRDDESVDASLSGREMYGRYADGRHEGLLEIDPDSAQEFADWIDGAHAKRTVGGHPILLCLQSNTVLCYNLNV
jgi:hypothetical protein